MATISKFYLLDAASPNTGTMPSNSPAAFSDAVVTGDAAAASTARDATDTHGSSNPDVESVVTATANQLLQTWGHRRFVSRPLAARTFALADGSWTFSYARSESNLNHNQNVICSVYAWRPDIGARWGTDHTFGVTLTGSGPPTLAATEQTDSGVNTWDVGTVTINAGDILVFDVYTQFTQGMSTAYTENFAYDGTTEVSTTTCASFVTPPAALTLFSSAAFTAPPIDVTQQAVQRSAYFCLGDLWARKGRLWVPTPRIATPRPVIA